MSEGRMQAYGWSLPARYSTEGANGSKGLLSVPVPIYCRPLNINEPGMKVLYRHIYEYFFTIPLDERQLEKFITITSLMMTTSYSIGRKTVIAAFVSLLYRNVQLRRVDHISTL